MLVGNPNLETRNPNYCSSFRFSPPEAHPPSAEDFSQSSLPLFVLGVLADDADNPFAADNLAVVANLLD
jgi:hypothetical protein